MSDLLGRFLWYDLNTTDVDAARSFYPQVLGWTVRKWPGEGIDYSIWHVGDEGVGGVAHLAEEAQAMGACPHWIAYLGVPDTAAAVDRATRAGASVLVPTTAMPEVGTMAIVADPQGAVFAFFTPDGPDGETVRPGVGRVTWNELMTDDLEAAWAFYSDTFGWNKVLDMDMGPAGPYRIFRSGEAWSLGGMMKKPGPEAGCDEAMPSAWSFYFRVPDLDAAVARAVELGGRLLNGPMEVPDGDRVAVLADPQGAVFGLHWMKHPDR